MTTLVVEDTRARASADGSISIVAEHEIAAIAQTAYVEGADRPARSDEEVVNAFLTSTRPVPADRFADR
jgi:hypothetical protein